MQAIDEAARSVPTSHDLVLGDARKLEAILDGSVHLVVTSPPYWTLKATARPTASLERWRTTRRSFPS